MLQQTTVNTVIPYYKRWMEIFPKIEKISRAPLRRVLKLWQGLGYYQRARNIHKSAKVICQKYGGRIPGDSTILKTLPGFGPYTTHAVLSIAFDQRQAIVDANVRRVLMRLLALKGQADAKKDTRILNFLEKILPSRKTGNFNQALMELGALVCRPNNPLCLDCPLKSWCKAYLRGRQDTIPSPKKKVTQNIEAACGVIEHKGRYFMQKRPDKGLLAGLWEFPGGKIKPGEFIRQAVLRELKEETGVDVVSCQPWLIIRHTYTRFKVKLHTWRCQVRSMPATDANHRWFAPSDFKSYPMPSATARIVEHLLKNSNP